MRERLDPNDILGKVYGRLTVRDTQRQKKDYTWMYKCSCECGSDCIVSRYHLINGTKKSCGCMRHLPDVTELHRMKSELAFIAEWKNK